VDGTKNEPRKAAGKLILLGCAKLVRQGSAHSVWLQHQGRRRATQTTGGTPARGQARAHATGSRVLEQGVGLHVQARDS